MGQGAISYRLRCQDNSYVTLRSRGFLEFNKQTGELESFVCINSVISEKDSEEEIRNHRRRLLPLFAGNSVDSLLTSISSDFPQEIFNMIHTTLGPERINKILSTITGTPLPKDSDSGMSGASVREIDNSDGHPPMGSSSSSSSNIPRSIAPSTSLYHRGGGEEFDFPSRQSSSDRKRSYPDSRQQPDFNKKQCSTDIYTGMRDVNLSSKSSDSHHYTGNKSSRVLSPNQQNRLHLGSASSPYGQDTDDIVILPSGGCDAPKVSCLSQRIHQRSPQPHPTPQYQHQLPKSPHFSQLHSNLDPYDFKSEGLIPESVSETRFYDEVNSKDAPASLRNAGCSSNKHDSASNRTINNSNMDAGTGFGPCCDTASGSYFNSSQNRDWCSPNHGSQTTRGFDRSSISESVTSTMSVNLRPDSNNRQQSDSTYGQDFFPSQNYPEKSFSGDITGPSRIDVSVSRTADSFNVLDAPSIMGKNSSSLHPHSYHSPKRKSYNSANLGHEFNPSSNL